jgi:hypothetical protein
MNWIKELKPGDEIFLVKEGMNWRQSVGESTTDIVQKVGRMYLYTVGGLRINMKTRISDSSYYMHYKMYKDEVDYLRHVEMRDKYEDCAKYFSSHHNPKGMTFEEVNIIHSIIADKL